MNRRNWLSVTFSIPLGMKVFDLFSKESVYWGAASRLKSYKGISTLPKQIFYGKDLKPFYSEDVVFEAVEGIESLGVENGDESCYTYSYDTNMFLEG
jgi:hypothetical protein